MRIQDLDFENALITVRDTKSNRDRVTFLPDEEWQYLFPARDLSVDPLTLAVKRHHLHPSGVQRAIAVAVRAAGITKHVTAHTLRAAFAHRLKETGCQLDDIQKLMGHADIRTTQHCLESQAPAHKRLRGPLSSKP